MLYIITLSYVVILVIPLTLFCLVPSTLSEVSICLTYFNASRFLINSVDSWLRVIQLEQELNESKQYCEQQLMIIGRKLKNARKSMQSLYYRSDGSAQTLTENQRIYLTAQDACLGECIKRIKQIQEFKF
ncbi:hypothetical protein BLOT_013215 [Blomia tropicalis]|nr:hypothetical protein BLOT_013215 [Blomia tropicalis]